MRFDVQLYGVLFCLSLPFLIGFEHEVTVNYVRGTERALRISNYPWIGFVLCFAIVTPASQFHTATSHYHRHPQTTLDGGSFKTIRYQQTGTQTNFGWPLSIASRAMRGFLFAGVTRDYLRRIK